MTGILQREKLYEALAYFAGNVRHAGTIKLFKLLYYLDLMHFRRTGRTVTGLVYEAWPMGPVPRELDNEFRDRKSNLHERFEIEKYRQIDEYGASTIDSKTEAVGRGVAESKFIPGAIRSKTPYRHQYLTMREMQLARQLAEIFRDATAEMMTDISHNKFGPWRKALQRANKQGDTHPPIDLIEGIVAVGDPKAELPADELKEIVAERALIEEALM
jgi:uncharacterized phage-associated protein